MAESNYLSAGRGRGKARRAGYCGHALALGLQAPDQEDLLVGRLRPSVDAVGMSPALPGRPGDGQPCRYPLDSSLRFEGRNGG